MAIDDNTSYELTGYQVKDLAQKIRAKADSASLASVATSGLYSDLTGAPTIPTVYNGTLTIQQNGATLGTFSANQSTDTTINLTGGGATYSDFTGATSSSAGTHGLVPAPAAGDQGKVLHGDGTWKDATAKLVEMSYGESNAWAKFIAAYNAGSIVYCRASSNSNPATGTQGRKAFMAYVNNATTPTEVEFQYVRSVSSKTDSQQSDQVFVYKLTNASGGTWTVATRNMSTKINVSGPITKTFTTGANATITIGADTMTGATSSTAGTAGVVPAPAAGKDSSFLRGDATWAIPAQAAMSGIWTNTTAIPSVASSASTTVDVSSLGFSSADDYIVVATNMGGGTNDQFLTITVPDANKTATRFTIMIWNAHWGSGAIGAGTKIQWAVFRLN